MEKPERKTFLGAVVFFGKRKESKMWKNQKRHTKSLRDTIQSKRQNMDTKWMEKEIKRSGVACVSESSIVEEKAKADVEMIK